MSRIFRGLVIAGLLVASRSFWMPFIGEALLVPDQNVKADCSVVLRGDDYFRFKKAAELLKIGQTPLIVTSLTPADRDPYDLKRKAFGLGQMQPKEIVIKYAQFFGAEPRYVFFTDRETTSTFEEAVQARAFLSRRGVRNLTLVTSGYHMRRALWIFRRVFKNSGIEIYPVTAPAEIYQPKTWWKKERDVRAIEAEYGAFIFNFIYHGLLKKNSTSFDSV